MRKRLPPDGRAAGEHAVNLLAHLLGFPLCAVVRRENDGRVTLEKEPRGRPRHSVAGNRRVPGGQSSTLAILQHEGGDQSKNTNGEAPAGGPRTRDGQHGAPFFPFSSPLVALLPPPCSAWSCAILGQVAFPSLASQLPFSPLLAFAKAREGCRRDFDTNTAVHGTPGTPSASRQLWSAMPSGQRAGPFVETTVTMRSFDGLHSFMGASTAYRIHQTHRVLKSPTAERQLSRLEDGGYCWCTPRKPASEEDRDRWADLDVPIRAHAVRA